MYFSLLATYVVHVGQISLCISHEIRSTLLTTYVVHVGQISLCISHEIRSTLLATALPSSGKFHEVKFVYGGSYRDRTYDPLLVRQMLSQLS